MGARTWEHVVVGAPIRWAADLLPEEVTAGRTALRISPDSSAESAFWGKESRRYPADWSHGPWSGEGYVELRPHSRELCEAVVHLRAPNRALAGLWWSRDRLSRATLGLALSLRYSLDAGAEDRRRDQARKAGAARSA